MSPPQSSNPKQVCEHILREGRRYNIENHILPSEIAVADRLLARGPELAEAYEELHNKLHAHPGALPAFFEFLLFTAAFWSLEKIAEARAARGNLAEVNRQIASKAEELASLLGKRAGLHNTSSFSSDTHYHVCEVIEAAASGNPLFQSYVKEGLEALRTRFDPKYWPTLSDFLRVLATDADAAGTETSDPLTAAATAATRPSRADFFKALFAAIEDNGVRHHGQLPQNFRATDNTLAALASCALGLGPNDSVDGQYVKRLRQRTRAEAD